MSHLLLAGYFGCGNLGDDAIMLGIVESLRDDGYEFTILSGVPEETFRNYGIRSVPRKDFAAVRAAIEKCDALVFAGGSIFQDVTSLKSVGYYAQLVKRAKAAGKRVVMVGQGVGPLNRFFGKRWACAAFEAADGIAVRDPASAAALKALGVKKRIIGAADCAFLLPPVTNTEDQSFQVGQMRTVGVSIRPHGKDKAIVGLFGDLSRMLFQNNMMPVLIEMDRHEDGPLILEISKQQGGKVPDLRKMQSPMQVQQRLNRMDSVIAMRLHAGILASTVGIPPFMVSYDPKVTAFAKGLDLPYADIKGLTAQRLFELFTAFQKNREKHLKVLERQRAEMHKLAQENLQLIRDIVPAGAKI
jgi:polysaccharide pyruvyl transferase CsaB